MKKAALALLVCVLLLPLALLLSRTARTLWPSSPRTLGLADGSSIVAVPLPRDLLEKRDKSLRVLSFDGTVEKIDRPVSEGPAPGAWVVRREDGPPLVGPLLGVVSDAGDTLRGKSAREALLEMPSRLRSDRDKIAREVRTASNRTEFSRAMERWRLFDASDRGVVAVFRGPGGAVAGARLSSIQEATGTPDGWIDGIRLCGSRLAGLLRQSPDSWGGGGLRPVLSGTLLLILLSGLFGGVPALVAAVRLADRSEPGRRALWVRRSSEWFSAVPGVVWGTIGAGVLVGALGVRLDRFFGDGVRWGSGGILWGAVTLGTLSAPTTLAKAMAAIDRVPRSWREIARSCGATRWQVLRLVVLPSCARGLAGAWFSGLARAAGETAPLLLVGAARALGGDALDATLRGPSLSGGFLHLGVLACDPPWPPLEAELGHPLAFLSLSVLACWCVGLEWLAVRFLSNDIQEPSP
jgi:ABC-type phosphate transport system permease subunit